MAMVHYLHEHLTQSTLLFCVGDTVPISLFHDVGAPPKLAK